MNTAGVMNRFLITFKAYPTYGTHVWYIKWGESMSYIDIYVMGWKANVILLTEHSNKMPSKFNRIRDAIFQSC